MLIESSTVLTERLKGCREFAGRDLSSRQEGSIDTPWQGGWVDICYVGSFKNIF